eukprot:253103_1
MSDQKDTTADDVNEKPTKDVVIAMQDAIDNGWHHTSDGYSVDEVLEHLSDCCEDGEYLDIYQILAFRWCQRKQEPRKFWVILLRAILAATTQLLGMIVVLYQEVNAGIAADDTLCVPNMPFYFKCLTCLFLWVIVVFAYDGFMVFRSHGMYRIHHITLHNMPDFINPFFVMLGRYINTIVMLFVLWGSFALVWSSTMATDIVLNAVAMFFMLELDDLFVSDQHYKDLQVFLKTYKHEENYVISNRFLWCSRITHYCVTSVVQLSLFASVIAAIIIGYCH